MEKLKKSFYTRDTLIVAKELLGKYLMVKNSNGDMGVRIVETEAYIGPMDKACHAYNNKRTERTKSMYRNGGSAYVYQIYGMHFCFNVVTENEEVGTAVLIRSGEPIEGLNQMSINRYLNPWNELTPKERINLTNGPGKLCKALCLDKQFNEESLLGDVINICQIPGEENFEIAASKRINIDYSEEAKDYKWRFYIKGNSYISKK